MPAGGRRTTYTAEVSLTNHLMAPTEEQAGEVQVIAPWYLGGDRGAGWGGTGHRPLVSRRGPRSRVGRYRSSPPGI